MRSSRSMFGFVAGNGYVAPLDGVSLLDGEFQNQYDDVPLDADRARCEDELMNGASAVAGR